MGSSKKKARLSAQKAENVIKLPFYRSPVFLFIAKLLVPLAVFYILFDTQVYLEYIFRPYANLHADVTGFFLKLFGQAVTVAGATVSSADFSIIIVRGCDPIEPSLIFTTAILAFPAAFSAKWKGILIGLPVIHLINLFRIVSLFLIGVYYPSWFERMHLQWWQVLFILIVISGWCLWLYYAVIRNRSNNSNGS